MKKSLNIINYAKGGIGNQLFQHIFGQSLSNKLNGNYYTDITSYSSDSYRNSPNIWDLMPSPKLININQLNLKGAYLLTEDNYKNIEDDLILPPDVENLVLSGYWQSESYMNSVYVKKTYVYLENKCKSFINVNLKEKIENQENSVALHIRRRDYAHMGLCKISYYVAAIEYLIEKMGEIDLYLFSDEPNFAQYFLINQNIKFTYVTHESDLAELYLMSLCKHYIISNSTFSFWAAYFGEVNGGIIFSPREWVTIDSTPSPIPSRWIQITDAINPYELNQVEKNKFKNELYAREE